MLEKFRKLAHDSHLNGDRVTEEYYLQFADHYFRVIADSRVRQDEPRQGRDDRWQDNSDSDREEANDYNDGYGDDRDSRNNESRGSDNRGNDSRSTERRERQQPRSEISREPEQSGETERADGETGEQTVAYEPPANPFVREGRGNRGLKQRRPRRDSQESSSEGESASRGRDASSDDDAKDAPPALDPATLPPAISETREETPRGRKKAAESASDEDAKPKRRTRRPRPPADETLQAVN